MAKRWIKYLCGNCGDENCGWDARSEWDETQQCEVLGQSFDDAWCPTCGADADPQETPMSRAEIAQARAALAIEPAAQLRAALAMCEAALALAVERAEANDCEGEERPFARRFRAVRREARAARLGKAWTAPAL